MGDLLSIDVAKPVQREMQMAQELGGIFERKILQHRLIVVSGADLVREVNDEEKWVFLVVQEGRRHDGEVTPASPGDFVLLARIHSCGPEALCANSVHARGAAP
ncbi:hypothetical protein [Rhodococcus sp. 5G237]